MHASAPPAVAIAQCWPAEAAMYTIHGANANRATILGGLLTSLRTGNSSIFMEFQQPVHTDIFEVSGEPLGPAAVAIEVLLERRAFATRRLLCRAQIGVQMGTVGYVKAPAVERMRTEGAAHDRFGCGDGGRPGIAADIFI